MSKMWRKYVEWSMQQLWFSGDKIDFVYAPVAQPEKGITQLRHRHRHAAAPAADLPVLAEDAAQAAAGEENSSRASCTADARLLAEMRGRARHRRQRGGGADAAG